MLRILIIDDEPDAVEHIKDELLSRNPEYHIHIRNFETGPPAMSSLLPHVVILDLIKGAAADGEDEGSVLLDDIWSKKCCPTIIHSARANEVIEKYQNNPFVHCIVKGSGADVKVADQIIEFTGKLNALRAVETKLHTSLNGFLTKGLKLIPNEFERDASEKLVERCALRHIAASIDVPEQGDTTLSPWECFLVIPVDPSLQIGDLLLEHNTDKTKADSYSIVLTPSCDLVSVPPRTPKIANVLTARCSSLDIFRSACGFNNISKGKFTPRIESFLTHGYYEHVMPLPGFPNRWPELAVNFRNLQLLELAKISIDENDMTGKTHLRISSLDSPFKETVGWAYAQYAAKIALPDRNTKIWADAISNSITFE